MIFVYEPQCRGLSHEKVNSGFLALVRRAFPDDVIRLYAEPTHRAALEAVLTHDGITIDRLEHRDVGVYDANSVSGAYRYYRELKTMLESAVADGVERVLVLSSNPVLLNLMKRLRAANPETAALRIAIVLHADFEDIGNTEFQPVAVTALPEPTFLEKLRMIQPWEVPGKAVALVRRRLNARYAALWLNRFRTKEQLERNHDSRLSYIALSPHVRTNAAQFIDVDALNVRVVDMPIKFAPVRPAPANRQLKLATFGYGDPAAVRQIVDALDAKGLSDYEIRIIGMDNRGLESHPHVTCSNPGKQLPRREMERQAEDIDAFLILYGHHRYRLSCSGAIFEALSYVKPVLHIRNPCVVQFDPPGAPIGVGADDLAGLADKIARMITDYPQAQVAFAERRANILRLRETMGGEQLAAKLRAAFM